MTLGYVASFIAVAAFVSAMIYVAVVDVLTMTISDRLIGGLLAGFPILAALSSWPIEEIGLAVAAALVAFFVSIALFSMGWIGGGDGKLLIVTVLWIGYEQMLPFALLTSALGGLGAAFLLVFRNWRLPGSWTDMKWVARLHSPDVGVPYGAAIGPAAILVLPGTFWVKGVF